jgi:hypothetical protein
MNGKQILSRVGLGLVLVIGLAASGAVESGEKASAAEASESLRVGAFDSRAVALAYGRSEGFLASVRELKREADEAEQEGRQERLEELQAKGRALQEQLHDQVFGGGPIDDILAELEDDLPQVARDAGVDLIVTGVLYAAPGAELVDVTLHMAAPFEPDEETLGFIRQLMEKPPVDPH